MNTKQFRYMQIFEQYVKDGILDAKAAKAHFSSLLGLDYPLALDTWDYVCTAYEQNLADSEEAGTLFGSDLFTLFYEKNAQRTAKALLELPQVRKAVFTYSPSADKGIAFSLTVDALVGNKTDVAEEYLKCLVKNERIAYGPFMKEVLERLFIEILKKNPSKRVEMSRKLSALLLTYIGKIKTDERAMLLQRVKETM